MTIEPALHNSGKSQPSIRLEAAYQEYAPQGIRYAHSMLRNESDAEEAVHEAFCRLLTKAEEWEDGLESRLDQFAPLFFATLRNLCIDLIRKNGRHRKVALEAIPELVAGSATNSLQQLESIVVDAMQQMPEQWADALRLKINGQLSYAEIGGILGVTHAQVRTRIFRARRYLESVLRKTGYLAVDK